jgi:hypothetical protein
MTWYLLVFSDKKRATGYAWGLLGLTAKLAQSVRAQLPARLNHWLTFIFADWPLYVHGFSRGQS